MKVNWSAGVVGLVPLQLVTVTSTVPVPGGDVAVMVVELTTVKVVAGVLPNLTPVTQVKPVPVMVTVVPPVDGPLFGTHAGDGRRGGHRIDVRAGGPTLRLGHGDLDGGGEHGDLQGVNRDAG